MSHSTGLPINKAWELGLKIRENYYQFERLRKRGVYNTMSITYRDAKRILAKQEEARK